MIEKIVIREIIVHLEEKLPPWLQPGPGDLLHHCSGCSPVIMSQIPRCEAPAMLFLAIQLSWLRPNSVMAWLEAAKKANFLPTQHDKQLIIQMFEELHQKIEKKNAPKEWKFFWEKPYLAFQALPTV